MLLQFTKMDGAGNDFILVDNRQGHFLFDQQLISQLCHRHRGIGADGLLIFEKPDSPCAQARMRYYNADGREAEMCGNGARCFTRYVASLLKQSSGKITFETAAGLLQGELMENQVKIFMSEVHTVKLHQRVGNYHNIHSINTGVPHALLIVDHLQRAPVLEVGRTLRYHPHFSPAGTNVDFIQILAPHSLAIRTYERGVEGETLACGTGVVAAALLYHFLYKVPSPISVLVQSQEKLEVTFLSQPSSENKTLPKISEITLRGPAEFVFQGSICI